MSKSKSKEDLLAEEEYQRALKKRAVVRGLFKKNASNAAGNWKHFVKSNRSF